MDMATSSRGCAHFCEYVRTYGRIVSRCQSYRGSEADLTRCYEVVRECLLQIKLLIRQ